MADIPVNTPGNLKIIKANEFIVDRCDFLICYVSHGWGGAAKTLERAEKNRLDIINIAKMPEGQNLALLSD